MLKLNNITKTFPGRAEPVLKNINLELKAGEFCMLIGANGAGKSTLMQLVAEHSVHKNTAWVVQDVNKGTIPEMTLLENMILSQNKGKKAKFGFYHRHKKEILGQLHTLQDIGIDLKAYIDRPLSCLSGGQRQMMATIMALHSKPDILLLDEPMSALDLNKQKTWIEYTTQFIENNPIASLMVTHNLEEALSLGTRLIVLHKGCIIRDVSGSAKSQLKVSDLLKLMAGEMA